MKYIASMSPEQRRQHILLLVIAFVYFSSVSFMLYLPRFVLHLGGQEDAAGMLVGIAFLPAVFLMPLIGALSDRIGGKWLLVMGAILVFAACMGMSLVTSLGWPIYALRLLHGAGHAMVFSPLLAMTAQCVSTEVRAQAIAYTTVLIQLGNVVGTGIGGWLIDHVGFLEYFYGAAAFAVLALIPVFRLADARWRDPAVNLSFFGVARLPGIRSYLLMLIALGGAFGVALQFVPTYFVYLYESGLTVASIPSAYFVTTVLITVAAVRIFHGSASNRISQRVMFHVCHGGLLAALLLVLEVNSSMAAIGVAVLFGVSYGVLYPVLTSLLFEHAPSSVRGRVSGLSALIYEFGFRGVPLVGGFVITRFSYGTFFMMLAGFYALSVVLSMVYAPHD